MAVGGLVGMAGMTGASAPSVNMHGKSIDEQIGEYVANHPEGKTNGVHRRDITSKFAAQMGGAPALEYVFIRGKRAEHAMILLPSCPIGILF